MKKIISIALIIALILLSAGCASNDKSSNSKSSSSLEKSNLNESENYSDYDYIASGDESYAGSADEAISGSSRSTGNNTNSINSKGGGQMSSQRNQSGTASSSTSGKSTSSDPNDVAAVPYSPSTSLNGKVTVDASKVINKNIIGPGVNFDFSSFIPINLATGREFDVPGARSQNIPYTTLLDENEAKEHWDEYFGLIDFMDFKYVRMSVALTMWEPINDNNDPKNTDFKNGFAFSPGFRDKHPEVPVNTYLYIDAMYKILDHFEKTGKYVILANWDRGIGEFCPGGVNWMSSDPSYDFTIRDKLGVKSLEEYTESLAAIMYHLKVEKKYTCVKGISFWNEPEGLKDYENTLVSVYNSLGAQLTRLGIRDKVLIQAYDGSTFWNAGSSWVDDQVSRMVARCGNNMDIISLHDYFSRMDYLENTPDGVTHGTISNFQLPKLVNPAVAQAGNRPVIMGEIGTFAFGGNVETIEKGYELQLHNAEVIVSGLLNGVKGFGTWIYNQPYHKYYSCLTFRDDNFRRFCPDSTNYYPTALYTKYIKSGSDVVSTSVNGLSDNNGQRVHAVTVKKGNDVTVLMVNDSTNPAKVSFTGLPAKTYKQHYVQKGKTNRIYPGTNYSSGDLYLRPQSITVLTTYTYGTQTFR